MDGNFKAEHLPDRCPADQVWLMDGKGYMVRRDNYKEYLRVTHHPPEVRDEKFPRKECNHAGDSAEIEMQCTSGGQSS